MSSSVTPSPKNPKKLRVLSLRRSMLLAGTIAGLGIAAFVVSPDSWHGYPTAMAQNLTEQAHKLQAPIGFADIVEKVKPAVISVRVRVDGGSQTDGLGNNEIPPGLRAIHRNCSCRSGNAERG